MPKIKGLANQDGVRMGYVFECPGCGEWHLVYVEQPSPRNQQWQWNGNMERPTFEPSILINWAGGYGPERKPKVCHSFVRDGHIQFLGDCTHALAGQTVDLPDMET